MREHSYNEDREEIEELLRQYFNLKSGKYHSLIEEDDFEMIMDYFHETDNLQEALEAATFGLEQYPYSGQLMIHKADLLLVSRKYNEALELLEHAEVYDTKNIDIYILKTDAYLALDQQQKAVDLLEDALSQFEGDEKLELLFELTEVYDDYEDFEKVFDCLKLILELEPNNEEALYKICFWTDFTRRFEEAIFLHLQIINEYPYNEIAWFNLGTAYQGLKLQEKAIDAYLYAIAIEEKFDAAYRNLGDAYLRLRKYEDAIEALEKSVELSRPEEVVHEAIGHCYHKMFDYAKARLHFKKASHLNPDDSKLQYKVALTYMLEKNWLSAIRHLENAMKIHKNIADFNLAMGECMFRLNRFKEAIQFFSNVIRAKPKNVAGWEALIRCLISAYLFEEAAEHCLYAIDKTINKPIFIFYHSACLFLIGKQKEALRYLELGMEKAPKLLKKFVELNPSILQNYKVVDIIARYKRGKKI